MNILVTGGASGLGESITKKLAKGNGNTVYFTYSKSTENANRIQNEFKNAVAVKCDFRDASDLESLIKRIEDFNLDVLINNAYFGDLTPAHFHKKLASNFLNEFRENIIPTIEITQRVISIYRKKKNGKIITVLTSYLTNIPPIGLSSYVANKAYLKKMTEIWANENIKFNITSNAISPSFMQTNLTNDVDDRIVEQMTNNHSLGKLLTIEEVADSIMFLANCSDHINGIDLLMNAGANIK